MRHSVDSSESHHDLPFCSSCPDVEISDDEEPFSPQQAPRITTVALPLVIQEVAAAAAAQVKEEPKPAVSAPTEGVKTAESVLRGHMDKLKGEGRYRVFFDIERQAGRFPKAFNHGSMRAKERTIDPAEVLRWLLSMVLNQCSFRSLCGATMIISAWANTLSCLTP